MFCLVRPQEQSYMNRTPATTWSSKHAQTSDFCSCYRTVYIKVWNGASVALEALLCRTLRNRGGAVITASKAMAIFTISCWRCLPVPVFVNLLPSSALTSLHFCSWISCRLVEAHLSCERSPRMSRHCSMERPSLYSKIAHKPCSLTSIHGAIIFDIDNATRHDLTRLPRDQIWSLEHWSLAWSMMRCLPMSEDLWTRPLRSIWNNFVGLLHTRSRGMMQDTNRSAILYCDIIVFNPTEISSQFFGS